VKRIVPDLVDFEKLLESGKWKDVVRAYLACVSFTDFNFGRVMDALAESNHAENTIVVIWSDHGYHVGEKSKLEKQALWEQTTRCLFMIRTPDEKAAGKTGSQTVSLLDIYPTLVDLCELKNIPDGQLDGRSLRPLLEDPESRWAHPAVTTYLKGNHAVRNDRYRYIHYPKIGEELYDLQDDPNEFTNLANRPEYEDLKKELQAQLPREDAVSAGKRPRPARK
jgi:arylsulfatase A-like enzyme